MTRWKAFSLLLVVAAIVASIVGPIPDAWAATFSDDNFLSQDWTSIIHVRDDVSVPGVTDMNSAGNMTRRTSDGVGNSAYFRSLIGLDLGDVINTSGIYIEETYDPSERAITTLNYSLSVNHFNSDINTSTSFLPALLQDGRLFVGPPTLFTGNSWVALTGGNLANLTEGDFFAVDFWFTQDLIHPDFSAFGETLQFGYSLQNDVAFGPGFVAARGVDNWSVTANLAAMSDIQGNGVDGLDLGYWSAGFGMAGDALLVDGDFDRDNDVDGADFLKWQRELGATSGLLAVAVPEPNTLSLLLLVFGPTSWYLGRIACPRPAPCFMVGFDQGLQPLR